MASNVDSVAVFEARAVEIGVSEAELQRLRSKGWNTFGRLAFACSYVPGQSDEAPLAKLAIAVIGESGTEPSDERFPIARRLFFEAYSLTSADMRSRVERRDEDCHRRLAAPERSARYDAQVLRLPGLRLTGELEPSHFLIDLVQSMAEENVLRYVRWEQCSKREQELMGVRLDPIWKPDACGIVRETSQTEELRADTSTDLLLKYALQRRSLAFDQCGLIEFNAFETWTTTLLSSYLRPPPEGYRRVSLEQLHAADLELFKCLMAATRSGIRATAFGQRPLEEALRRYSDSAEVRLYLQPLQGKDAGAQSKRKRDDHESGEIEKLRRQVSNLEGRLKNAASSSKPDSGHAGGGKGSGSRGAKPRKGGKTRGAFKLPKELEHLDASGPEGPRCFAYNMDGCKGAKPGGRCNRGLHVCMVQGCGKPHSQREHR